MGSLTESAPKCLAELQYGETILGRQLRLLTGVGICDIVITTGYCDDALREYALQHNHDANLTFVNNPEYAVTNYMYSIWLACEHLDDDILLLHGDLVFEPQVLSSVLSYPYSCVVTQSSLPLSEKDFKAEIIGGRVKRIGVDVWNNAVACQPLYKLTRADWSMWRSEIERFVADDNIKVYAENAFNEVSDNINLHQYDVGVLLCREIDTADDLTAVNKGLGKRDE
jgi:phosphoenolpyruvate phosphomutase